MYDETKCPICGAELRWVEYKEPHLELGAGVYEVVREPYCPKCGYNTEQLGF